MTRFLNDWATAVILLAFVVAVTAAVALPTALITTVIVRTAELIMAVIR